MSIVNYTYKCMPHVRMQKINENFYRHSKNFNLQIELRIFKFDFRPINGQNTRDIL